MTKMLSKKMRKNQKGFTLIELIVVISILGILAAIAVPRFGGFTADAQTAADQATARTILSAVTMAEAQTADSSNPKNGTTDEVMADADLINNFLSDPKVAIGTGDATAGWTVNYADGKWSVYKNGALIN